MRGGPVEAPSTEDLARDPSRRPETPTDRLPVQRTALNGATVELPPRCRRGDVGCVPALIGMRVLEHPPAPPSASALSARQWRRVRWAVTGGVFVLLTAVGVDVGLRGAPTPAPAPVGSPVVATPPRPTPAPGGPAPVARATAGQPRAPEHPRVTAPGRVAAPWATGVR